MTTFPSSSVTFLSLLQQYGLHPATIAANDDSKPTFILPCLHVMLWYVELSKPQSSHVTH
jgi:hypothetical protein